MGETKERPILFSAPMVRAILAGKKSQTRRVVKLNQRVPVSASERDLADGLVRCPYGATGDRLWVRETWADGRCHYPHARAVYRADAQWNDGVTERLVREEDKGFRWRPSIFMPRWACRILLEVTSIRSEKLQDISEEDAKAEGSAWRIDEGGDLAGVFADCGPIGYRNHYRDLWEDINGEGSWEANPWVWVVGFKRLESAAVAA